MSAKKKTAAKKTAKHIVSKFDKALDAMDKKAAIPVVAHVNLPNDTMLDADDFNPHAPPPKTNILVHTKDESKTETTGEIGWEDTDSESPEQEQSADEPALGSGEPVDASEGSPVDSVPELGSDAAKTITDLIDGMNYLYGIAKQVKGIRGLKQHDEPVLRARVKRGRDLVKLLQQ